MAARGVGSAYQGMNWIRQEKRLAIYIRDGMACAYCNRTIEEGVRLTLDHIIPFGDPSSTHHADNLITACLQCNSARGAVSIDQFASEEQLAYIIDQTFKPLDVPAAKALIAQRRMQ